MKDHIFELIIASFQLVFGLSRYLFLGVVYQIIYCC